MNEVKLSQISNREDYSETFQAIDEEGEAIDLTGATIVCEMREPLCSAATALTVEIDGDEFTISLTESQTRSLNLGDYQIGCTIEIDDFVSQFFVGTLPVIDGIIT